MKKKLCFSLLTPFMLLAQNNVKTCEILSKINLLIQREHYHPKPIDDSLSVYVFDSFIDELDENRNLFTKIEYDQFCKYRLQLDDYILQKDCTFMDDFYSAYLLALERKKEKNIRKITK